LDTLSPEARSERMALIRGKDTKPEMVVRRLVHSMGYRYRLHVKGLPGKPDLAFRSRKKVIWVHGCFWHRHDDPQCKLARLPKSRVDFWREKLEGNRQRDLRHQQDLVAMGWSYIIVWECQLKGIDRLRERIVDFLG